MYDNSIQDINLLVVTGPCEFLVMYDLVSFILLLQMVTGPCEFLVMYDFLLEYQL